MPIQESNSGNTDHLNKIKVLKLILAFLLKLFLNDPQFGASRAWILGYFLR